MKNETALTPSPQPPCSAFSVGDRVTLSGPGAPERMIGHRAIVTSVAEGYPETAGDKYWVIYRMDGAASIVLGCGEPLADEYFGASDMILGWPNASNEQTGCQHYLKKGCVGSWRCQLREGVIAACDPSTVVGCPYEPNSVLGSSCEKRQQLPMT